MDKLGFKESQQRSETGLAYTKEGKRLENPKILMVNDVLSIIGEIGAHQAQHTKNFLEKMDEEYITKKNMYVLAVLCIFSAENNALSDKTLTTFKKKHNGMPFEVSELDLIRYYRSAQTMKYL